MSASGNLLSLDRYARIMSINPVHFQGAFAQSIWPVDDNRCEDLWVRHAWVYSDHLSHEDLAQAIQDAEYDLAHYLGYWPAPVWISREMQPGNHFHRRDTTVRAGNSVIAKWGKIVSPGRRATTLIETATLTAGTLAYSDEDSDGFAETATITVATTVTDACELKVYFSGTSADPQWEVRPPRSKTISAGVATLVFDSWLFIDPELLSAAPTVAGYAGIDISTTAYYVTGVDVYREYTDTTSVSAQMYWESNRGPLTPFCCVSCGGVGCVNCGSVEQDGCAIIRDVDAGILAINPAHYDTVEETWVADTYTVCRAPDQYKVWYYAGDQSNRYLSGTTCDPLSDELAHAIAWMATARLEREFCTCGNVNALADKLRMDMAFVGQDNTFFVNRDTLDNPFGTRYGEVAAWRRVSRLLPVNLSVAVI